MPTAMQVKALMMMITGAVLPRKKEHPQQPKTQLSNPEGDAKIKWDLSYPQNNSLVNLLTHNPAVPNNSSRSSRSSNPLPSIIRFALN
jgi:hypothetical protein